MFAESNPTILILAIVAFIGIFVFFATLRIFVIDKTLREILEILKTRIEKNN